MDPILSAIRACEAGNFAAGVPVLEEAVQQVPDHIPALLALGAASGQQQQFDKARAYFERVLEIDAKAAIAHTNLGNVCRYSGDLAGAAKYYRHAIELQPSEADAHYNLAGVLLDLGDLEGAEQSLRRAILFRPQYAEAYNNLGDILMRQGQVEDALTNFRQALVWRPSLEQAQNNLILALYRLGNFEEAEAVANQALRARPNDLRVMETKALGLLSQGKFSNAERIYRKMTVLYPDQPSVWVNFGGVLQALARYDESIKAFEHAMTLRGADQALLLSCLAGVMLSSDRPGRAAENLKRATLLESRHAPMLANLATALVASGEVALGIENMRRAVSLMPKSPELRSSLLYVLHFDANLTPKARFDEACRWDELFGSPKQVLPPMPKRKLGQRDRLRIGFVSPDLRQHSVATCLEPLLANIDKTRFEVSCYATSGANDAVTDRLRTYVDAWRRVAPLSPLDLSRRIRADGIDVLIDLSWHTGGNRLSMFALRPAPIQISWLGFFASTGLSAIDYRITDDVMDPRDQGEELSSERLLRLPVAMPFRPPAGAPAIARLPMARNGYPTFAVISRFSRANAAVLDTWAELLHARPDARLLILSGIAEQDQSSLDRIRRLLALREIETERVDIRPKMPLKDYLRTITHDTDVILDTFPYCGGVTTAQALWMGVPSVTLAGASTYERTAASLLTCAGLQQYVADSREAYVKTALSAVEDAEALTKLRRDARKMMEATPIVDGAQFARAFEAAVLKAWEEKVED